MELNMSEIGMADRIRELYKQIEALKKENAELTARLEKAVDMIIEDGGCERYIECIDHDCESCKKYLLQVIGDNAKQQAEKRLAEIREGK